MSRFLWFTVYNVHLLGEKCLLDIKVQKYAILQSAFM